jgi:long-chain fatty acid transport protein
VFNTIIYNWKNTWRYSAGINYNIPDQWKLRAGVAFDQTVVRNQADREARLPDSDRLWLAAGARYRPNGPCLLVKTCWIDVALSYVRPKDAPVDRNNGSTERFGLLSGSFSSDVFIIGLQATAPF